MNRKPPRRTSKDLNLSCWEPARHRVDLAAQTSAAPDGRRTARGRRGNSVDPVPIRRLVVGQHVEQGKPLPNLPCTGRNGGSEDPLEIDAARSKRQWLLPVPVLLVLFGLCAVHPTSLRFGILHSEPADCACRATHRVTSCAYKMVLKGIMPMPCRIAACRCLCSLRHHPRVKLVGRQDAPRRWDRRRIREEKSPCFL